MKTLISSLVVLAALAGVANAAPVAPAQTDTVIGYGCGYGH